MLALAHEHVLDREQFGRPLASFQALRHRLAETYVVLEAAEAVLVAAAPETAGADREACGALSGNGAPDCNDPLAGSSALDDDGTPGGNSALYESEALDSTGALLAKAAAGRAALTAARHCQQALGGIGFTAEHALHRHVKRALVLDGLLGSTRELTREAGRLLLREARAPRLVDL